MMHVLVRSLAGEELDCLLPNASTVLDLKQRVAKHWSYPLECLQLLAGTKPLVDAQRLAHTSGAGCAKLADGRLELTAIVSVEALQQQALAEAGSRASRSAALHALAEVALPEEDCRTVHLVAMCLRAREPEVRRTAINALLRLSQRGHHGTIAAVVGQLVNQDPDVRVAAALSLLRLAPRGDGAVLEAMSRLLDDPNAEVRRIALHVLTQGFDRGETRVVALVTQRLQEAGSIRTYGLSELLWVRPSDALELFKEGLALFFDARDEEAFSISRIYDALSMPGHTSEQLRHLHSSSAFHAIHSDSPKIAIVYSDTGSDLSHCAWVAKTLRESPGIQVHRVLRLVGGLNAWKSKGLPVYGNRSPQYAGSALP